MTSAVDAVTDSALDSTSDGDLQTGGRGFKKVSPAFGVFSDGSLSYTNHAGYTVNVMRNGAYDPMTERTGRFTSTQASLNASVILHVNKLGEQGGDAESEDQAPATADPFNVFIGAFGGYANNYARLRASSFSEAGRAQNEAYMLGAYGIASYGNLYTMASVAGSWGDTETRSNMASAQTVTYDTSGVIVKGLVGTKVPLENNFRLDFRGGLLYSNFGGDGFVDGDGQSVPGAKVDFEQLSGFLGIGMFKVIQTERAVIQPYARIDLRQVLDETNRFTDSAGNRYDFSADDKTNVRISGGFFSNLNETLSFGGEAYGNFAGDVETYGAKLSLKIKLN